MRKIEKAVFHTFVELLLIASFAATALVSIAYRKSCRQDAEYARILAEMPEKAARGCRSFVMREACAQAHIKNTMAAIDEYHHRGIVGIQIDDEGYIKCQFGLNYANECRRGS